MANVTDILIKTKTPPSDTSTTSSDKEVSKEQPLI